MQPEASNDRLPVCMQLFEVLSDELLDPEQALRAGRTCPLCGQGDLEYDGLLNLSCPACGYTASGGGGCT